jgi:K+-transporting ATPase ATPase C chain
MKEIKTSFVMLVLFILITGFLYPLAITGVGAVLFPRQTGGSLISDGTMIIGSKLMGQMFKGPKYFHGRPSFSNYDGMNSGGTNLGPTNRKLVDQVRMRAEIIRKENGLAENAMVPADLVLTSGSGLDPHISLEGALMQAPRVARERKLDISLVADLVMKNSRRSYFNIHGELLVNVLALNLALDSSGGN